MPTDPLASVNLTRFQASIAFYGSPYVAGTTYAVNRTATFEFKPGSTGYTGGGYARVRSVERGPESGHGCNDVFASIHRLMAVVHCYPEDTPLREIQNHMIGRDVHHELGMPSANVPNELTVMGHAEHSGLTNATRRAWAEDAKRKRDAAERGEELDPDVCAKCGDEDTAARLPHVDGPLCLECATENADGEAIEIV